MENIQRYLETKPHLPQGVVGFFRKGDHVLIAERKKSSTGLAVKKYSGIGGRVGDQPEFVNETHEDAMIREAWEEVKVKVTSLIYMGNIKFLFPSDTKWNLDTSIYIIDDWEGEPQETESMRPEWVHKDEMPYDKMFTDNYLWVPKVLLGQRVKAMTFHDSASGVSEHLVEVEE